MYDITSEAMKISFIEPHEIENQIRKKILKKKTLRHKNLLHRLMNGNNLKRYRQQACV